MSPRRLTAYILMFIATLIWAWAGPVIKFTLGEISPLPFLAYRFAISGVLSLVSIIIVGKIPKNPKLLAQLAFYGFLTSTVSLALLFFGLEKTTVLDLTLMDTAIPLIITMAGVHYLHEHVTAKEKKGIAIALIGTAIVAFEPLFSGHGGVQFSGNLLILAYILVAASATVMGKRFMRAGVSPLFLMNISFVVGAVTTIPWAIYEYGTQSLINSVSTLTFPYHLGVLYMALLSGNLAYLLSNKAQKSIEVGEASLFTYLYPILAAPLAILWLGEKITPAFIIGGVIIAIGVIIAEVKQKKS